MARSYIAFCETEMMTSSFMKVIFYWSLLLLLFDRDYIWGFICASEEGTLLPLPQSLTQFISNFILQKISEVQFPTGETLRFSIPQLSYLYAAQTAL